ncbi:DUF5362 family protein [Pullulanibacillus sp. KACC 23026]|uniref:DUF5362 family protein n=1 Tax=Pullulanibacillus sp. KACC 23026 TaxID=3028315 RepID=UPI0023AED7C4|nr:DUF5362 family protein [Pullulanibacillus sp. KACC 23026]WEG14747.1 DUF5362 family protein [Pullulanibacillus sp. KACC 23026]
MEEKRMKRIAFWGRFMGILTMIVGCLSAIGGLFCFVVGAIPGIMSVITGYFIYKSGSEAALYLRTKEEGRIEGILDYYSKYLFLQGLLVIIAVVLFIIMFLIMGAVVMSGFHHVMSLR